MVGRLGGQSGVDSPQITVYLRSFELGVLGFGKQLRHDMNLSDWTRKVFMAVWFPTWAGAIGNRLDQGRRPERRWRVFWLIERRGSLGTIVLKDI